MRYSLWTKTEFMKPVAKWYMGKYNKSEAIS
jgi:hypothetical protein